MSEKLDTLSHKELEKLPHSKQVQFACFCAEQVLHLVRESDRAVCTKAIETAYLYLEGKATAEDCRNAAYAADTAAYAADTAAYAADTAAYAAYAADTAANAAAYAADTAANAAAAVATYAAYAAYAAANAAYAANAATYAADAANVANNRDAAIKAQWNFYDQLLNGDRYFEEIVLK